jgi:Iron-sulfur cluster-binding domain
MGELFLDPDVFWKIAYVQDAGLELIIQTNAALLTTEKTERLNACGFKGPIYISFHGITRPVYENLMGLPYDRTLANIHFLLNRYERAKIQIRAYAHEWPLGEAFRVKKYWKAHNVSVKLGVPNSRGGLLSGIKRTNFKYPGPWLRGCKKTLPFRDLVVSFDGKAVLCCEDMGRRVILGDLSQKSLMEVWNSPEAERIMNFLHGGGWGKQDNFLCRSCEFGLSTPFRRLMKNLDSQWQLLTKTKL